MEEKKRWLTMRDVSRILEISYPTVARMVQDGRISAVRVGRQYRIAPEQLDAYIKINTTSPPLKLVGEE